MTSFRMVRPSVLVLQQGGDPSLGGGGSGPVAALWCEEDEGGFSARLPGASVLSVMTSSRTRRAT